MLRAGLLISIVIFIFSCAGTKPQANWSAAQYYHYAYKLFEDEDYYEASNEFTVVVLRYAGTSVADSAQFYLAESHFKMDEFLIAAVEYEKLMTSMSRSPLVPRAQFQQAESYYMLSPRPELEQQYTLKAIRAYQTFIEDYPTHELKAKAEKRIFELRDKLAEKAYDNAEIYRKMREYGAAIIYYNMVLEKYYDSSWADNAVAGKIETYLDSEDYAAAAKEVDKFKQQFPDSDLKDEVQKQAERLAEDENQKK